METEIPDPDSVAGFGQPLDVPQIVCFAACKLDTLGVELRAKVIVHCTRDRIGHDLATALAETEMAERLRARGADPARPAGNPRPSLVEMLDRCLRHCLQLNRSPAAYTVLLWSGGGPGHENT